MKTDPLPESTDTIFSRDATWQAWLEVERALALTQAEQGMIPAAAAAEIARCATLDQLDREALAVDIERTLSPVMSLVRALAARCDGDAGGYVHLGATTQNIILTGKMLQLARSHRWLKAQLAAQLECLADLAERGAEWPCVSRTNRRHALPITFGYKVAGWIEELERNVERLEAVESRAFVLTFGGASGAMHSYGDRGAGTGPGAGRPARPRRVAGPLPRRRRRPGRVHHHARALRRRLRAPGPGALHADGQRVRGGQREPGRRGGRQQHHAAQVQPQVCRQPAGRGRRAAQPGGTRRWRPRAPPTRAMRRATSASTSCSTRPVRSPIALPPPRARC
nr:lyase family protein [Salinicola tamaricis]